jgi:hypothetical protein
MIVGGKGDDGRPDPYKLLFVFKKGFRDGFPSDKEVPTSKRKFTTIMKFSHYWKHVTFVSKGDRERMKVQSDLIGKIMLFSFYGMGSNFDLAKR